MVEYHSSTDRSGDVPFWWVLLFLAMALGAGAFAVYTAGGTLVA